MLTKDESKKANDASLVEMPKSMMPEPNVMPGANCENCVFYSSKSKYEGHCSHPKIGFIVRSYWVCKYWRNPKIISVADKYGQPYNSSEGISPWAE